MLVRRWTVPMTVGLALLVVAGCERGPAAPPERGPDGAVLVAGGAVRSGAIPIVCDRDWAVATDGDWSDAGSWTPAGVPAAADTVCFVEPGGYTVTLLTNATVQAMTFTSGANVAFTAGASSLTVRGASRSAPGPAWCCGARSP